MPLSESLTISRQAPRTSAPLKKRNYESLMKLILFASSLSPCQIVRSCSVLSGEVSRLHNSDVDNFRQLDTGFSCSGHLQPTSGPAEPRRDASTVEPDVECIPLPSHA